MHTLLGAMSPYYFTVTVTGALEHGAARMIDDAPDDIEGHAFEERETAPDVEMQSARAGGRGGQRRVARQREGHRAGADAVRSEVDPAQDLVVGVRREVPDVDRTLQVERVGPVVVRRRSNRDEAGSLTGDGR